MASSITVPIISSGPTYFVISSPIDLSLFTGTIAELEFVLYSGVNPLTSITQVQDFTSIGNGNYAVIPPWTTTSTPSNNPNFNMVLSTKSGASLAPSLFRGAARGAAYGAARGAAYGAVHGAANVAAHSNHLGHNDCIARAQNGYSTKDLQFFNGDAQWM